MNLVDSILETRSTHAMLSTEPIPDMSPEVIPHQIQLARQLIHAKGLSREDLALLEEILRLGLTALVEAPPATTGGQAAHVSISKLQTSFGIFLGFLNQFTPKGLGEIRSAMGFVLQHSLMRLSQQAEIAHRELLAETKEPQWVAHLLDLLAAVRAFSVLGLPDQKPGVREYWSTFLADHREAFKEVFSALTARGPEGSDRVVRLNNQIKTLNRELKKANGRGQECLLQLAELLENAIPERTRSRVEPLLFLEHVTTNLRLSLIRPFDQGTHWPAVEQVRGSLQWLWNHLGWDLPRLNEGLLRSALPEDALQVLKQLRKDSRPAFLLMARAIANHLKMMNFLESNEPAANASEMERYALVPTMFVVSTELGHLAETVYAPEQADTLPAGSPEIKAVRALLQQVVLALRQDQVTIRSLIHQALASLDVDQLGLTLDNLRSMLINHQKQLIGDMLGIFAPDLRPRLFPGLPSQEKESDQLRQRLYRLWEQLEPLQGQLELNRELGDWPRLALGLSQANQQFAAFWRSPEFLLIRAQDRKEAERLILLLNRLLDNPKDINVSLLEGAQVVSEMMRFLELFLLRINARIPLIRYDLEMARDAYEQGEVLKSDNLTPADRTRLTQRFIQSVKKLGVRDSQVLALLKRWVGSERNNRDSGPAMKDLTAHIEHLIIRLEAALA